MKVKFQANKITYATSEKDNSYMVAFSDKGDSPDEYVILQKGMSFEEQDIEMGMDTYFFEYTDDAIADYGVCKSVRLTDNNILFELDKEISEEISEIEISFIKSNIKDWAGFVEHLRFILEGVLIVA